MGCHSRRGISSEALSSTAGTAATAAMKNETMSVAFILLDVAARPIREFLNGKEKKVL